MRDRGACEHPDMSGRIDQRDIRIAGSSGTASGEEVINIIPRRHERHQTSREHAQAFGKRDGDTLKTNMFGAGATPITATN